MQMRRKFVVFVFRPNVFISFLQLHYKIHFDIKKVRM